MSKKSLLNIILTICSKQKKSKNIVIDNKNYKGLVNYFTRYVHSKPIKVVSLNYHELIGKIEEHERKNI